LSKARHSLMFYSKATAYPRGKQLNIRRLHLIFLQHYAFVSQLVFKLTLPVCLSGLSVYPSVCPFVCPSVRPSTCPSLCLSISLSVSLSVHLSVCLSLSLSVHQSICLSVCLSIFSMSICLSVGMSICLSVCLLVCRSACLSVFLSPHFDYLLISLHSFNMRLYAYLPLCTFISFLSLSLSLLFVEYSKCYCTKRN
jgi:hypothetical protein